MTMEPFDKLAIIGLGLIGASIAHAARRAGVAGQIAGHDASADVLKRAHAIGFADTLEFDIGACVADADLIGCPIRVTVGKKSLEDGMVDVKDRASGEETRLALSELGNKA